jgi:rare lipoprotein A
MPAPGDRHIMAIGKMVGRLKHARSFKAKLMPVRQNTTFIDSSRKLAAEPGRTKAPLFGGGIKRNAPARYRCVTPLFCLHQHPVQSSFSIDGEESMRKLNRLVVVSLIALPILAQAGDRRNHLGEGMASYYGAEFGGSRTASGERFDPAGMTAAHRTLAFHSRVAVTNLANGKEVVVRINDRGPWGKGRIIDISHAAAKQIGMHHSGTARVKLELLD